MNLEELEKKIEKNANKINTNADKIYTNLQKIEKNSYALEILSDYKKESKRFFIALIIVLVFWFVTIGYLVYILNDTGTIKEDSIEIQDVETIDNSHIKIGDDVWEKSK